MNFETNSSPAETSPLTEVVCDHLELAVVVLTAGQRIQYLNHAARLLFEAADWQPGSSVAGLPPLPGDIDGAFSLTLAAPDGERHYHASLLRPDPDAPDGVRIVTFQDQTEQVHLARRLLESDDRLRAIGQAATDAIIIVNEQCKVLFANAATESILGWSAADLIGQHLCDLLGTERFRSLAFPTDPDATGEGHARHVELSTTRRNGETIELEMSITHFRASRGLAVLAILRDVSERVARERRLQEAEARWQFALEGNGDAVWDWDLVTGAILFSPNFKAMLGYAESELGDDYSAWETCIHPDDLPRVRAQLDAYVSGRSDRYICELRMRRADGEFLWIQDRGMIVARDQDGRPVRMVGTQRDISDSVRATASMQQQLVETLELNHQLEEAQLQLVQSEKLSVIGQLAAGVAHEMNTPLGFVNSNLNTLERYARQLLDVVGAFRSGASELGEDHPALAEAESLCQAADMDFMGADLPALLTETRDGLDRVLSIVRDLRDFSRVGEQQWQSTNLHRGLDSTLNILHNQLKHTVEVVRDYGEVPEVWCIPSQINQVFLNLLNNASQAIPGRGTITIRTRVEDVWAVVLVEDTGSGMSEEQLGHIFEPFFTTKPTGKGTGLGLSLSLDIVRRHSGTLSATSTPGTGSVFTLKLPLNAGPIET